MYRENEKRSEFCGKMDGLAFLPIDDVKNGMTNLPFTYDCIFRC